MLVIWIGLVFGSLLQICSCDTNETSWLTQKTVSDLEEKVNASNNSIQNSGIINVQTGALDSLIQPEVGHENLENSSNENNMLVKRDIEQVNEYSLLLGENLKNSANENNNMIVRRDIEEMNGYSTLGENRYSNFMPHQFETNGDNFKGDEEVGEEMLQENLDGLASDENNEAERLTSGFAPFYQPAGRSYLGELGHKVSKLFGGGDSPDYYEKPFGSQNSFSRFQRHEENLNNALTFRDIVEGNQAAVRKDVNLPESDLNTNFQEKRGSNDYNDVDDSWLMSSMSSDQSIVDDAVQSSNIFDNGRENFAYDKNVKESMYNDENNNFNDRRLRQIQQTEKSDEMVDAQEITHKDINTINAENSDSILQRSAGNFVKNVYVNPNTQENCDGSYLLGNNNKKRDVNILDGSTDEKSKFVDSKLEDSKITEDLDSHQETSFEDSQDFATSNNNDESLNQKRDENQESKPTNVHKRNGMHRLRKKMHSQIMSTSQDVLPLKMDDSLSEQSPPISSIDNGGGILLKDLDLQNENKSSDANEDKNSKPLLSQSAPTSDIRNKDKNLILNEQQPKLSLQDDSIMSSVVDVSSLNSGNEAKLSQNSLGESIMESIDGVKTLKLSSVNFKSDDSNESNLSSDLQSSADKKAVKKQRLQFAATRHPIKLSHKNKHRKLNSSKGRIVSSYNRNGLLKTTTISPATTLDSRDNDAVFNSKLFIHEKDRPLKRKQSSNTVKKGIKEKEEKLDGFYSYDTTTKGKKVHNIKKNDNKHKSGIANTKMVKVKLSVSPCQFNKEKYLINNKSASKANVPKILSSRSVKQNQKQLNTTVGADKFNATTSKMLSEGKFDATTQKMLKQEKLSAIEPSKGKNPANDLESPNFFDKTTPPSKSTLQQTSNSVQKGSQTNGNSNKDSIDDKSNMKSSTLDPVPQKEIKDVPSTTTTRTSGLVPMNSHSARKHSKSGHIPGKKHDSASLNEDNACDGDNDDDDEYSDSCERSTKSVCKTTKSECSTTETQSKTTEESDEDVCDPLEENDEDDETDGPCDYTEDACETTKAPCGTTKKVCETTEEPCGTTPEPCEITEATCETTAASCETTESPCETTAATSETTQAPCETTTAPCETTEAPCGTTVAPCETTEAPCGTTVAPCETTAAPIETTEAPCETTETPSETTADPCITTEDPCETTDTPCETTEDPCETTEAPCETTEAPCETTEAPCETTEDPCETTEDPCMSSPPPSESTKAVCEDEEIETDPPCKTTKICKTASKKGNSTSEVNNEYVDKEDDDDEYDYETE